MKGRVRWDEANIVGIETNKPVRQKIAEPKTPYHPMIEGYGSMSPIQRDSFQCDLAAHAGAIISALNNMTSSRQKHSSQFGGWTSSDDEALIIEPHEVSEKDRSGMTFREHRGAHYDEFREVKELRQNGIFLDEYDEGRRDSSSSLDIGVRTIDIVGDDEIMRPIDIKEDDESLPQQRSLPPFKRT